MNKSQTKKITFQSFLVMKKIIFCSQKRGGDSQNKVLVIVPSPNFISMFEITQNSVVHETNLSVMLPH